MIGIVVVSHSRPLAEAAVTLAEQMVVGDRPRIAIAAGTEDGGFGTQTSAISLAIESVDSPDGVLVLLDLGSALVSTELAVQFLDRDLANRVMISPAPLVEGLLVAVVTAATGASLAEVGTEARRGLEVKRAQLGDAVEEEPSQMLELPRAAPAQVNHAITWRTTVRNPHGIHIRPAAAIVTTLRDFDAEVHLTNASTGRGPVPALSINKVTGLEVRCGEVLQARITGPQAGRARDALSDLAVNNFGEGLHPKTVQTRLADLIEMQPTSTETASSRPASDQLIVSGIIDRRVARPNTSGYRPGAPKEELARFNDALDRVADLLIELATNGSGVPGILNAQVTLLQDREFHHDVVSRITEGFSAIEAVDEYLTGQAHAYDDMTDSYLRDRGQDVRSLRRLLLVALMNRSLEMETPDEPRVWLVEELDVATAVRLDPRLCLGIITTAGGAAGHGVLCARARGVPVLAGYPDARRLNDGDPVAFDPTTRQVWVHPDAEALARFEAINQRRVCTLEEAMSHAGEPAITRSGRRIEVQANVASLEDARRGVREGADGFGIVRTELLYGAAPKAPTACEQAELLTRIGTLLDHGRMTVRTWDVGGDKPLPFVPHREEMNPALGERGIRAMRRHEELFVEQLRAVLLTANETPVRLLLPMVTEPEEVVWARSLLSDLRKEIEAPHIPLGIMIEVPSAALRAGDFADLVDYVSFGTNDLTQYLLAADRANSDVRHLAHQDAKVVLNMIGMVAQALPGIPVAVCGDLASDPLHVGDLLDLGVSELSVLPPMVSTIKQAVRMT